MSREAISDDSLKQLKNRLMCEAQHLISDIRKEQKKFIDVSINETCQNVEPIEVIELLSRRILTTQTKKKLHFQWGSDCRHILASQDEGGVSYWDAYGSCKEAIFGSEDKWICSCSISPNCSFACYGGENGYCHMSKIPEISNSNKPPKIVNESEVVGNHKGLLSCCSFFGSEHQILTAGSDCDLILWDVESGSELSKLSGHDGTVLNFSVSPTDMCRLVASSSIDKSVRIWDMRSNKTVQIFDQHDYNVNCVEFLRTGESIISGSDDAKCRFFDLRSDKLIGVYQKNSVLFGVNDLDVSSSGRILFSGHHDGTINVWDTLKFCRLQITYGHDERISCLKTSPDGLALATSSWDSTIKVWS